MIFRTHQNSANNGLRLHLIFALILSLPLAIIPGCGGGGGNGGGGTQTTITSVTVGCSPSSILTGQTSACTPTVTGTGSYSSSVTWSVSPTTIGSVSSTGVFTPTAAGSATITATSTQDTSKSGSATVTVNLPPTITSVTVSCSPTSLILGSGTTATCSASVQGTGNFSSSVNWTSSSGTITSSGVFTPASGGTVTITATSTADSTKSGQSTITVSVPPSSSGFQIVGPRGGRISALAADPSSPGTFYAVAGLPPTSNLFKSTDGASSWTRIVSSTNANALQGASSVSVGQDGTVYLSCDSCIQNSTGSYGPGLFKSTDHGNTFTEIGGTINNVWSSTPDPLNSQVIYASDTKGGVYRSEDAGTTWKLIIPDSTSSQCSSVYCVTGVVPDAATDGVLYLPTGASGVSVSHDFGTTWSTLKGSPSNASFFAQSPSSPQRLYVGAPCVTSGCGGGEHLYVSSDGGATWTDRGSLDSGAFVINPQNPDELYDFANSFYDSSTNSFEYEVMIHSTDGGASWSTVNEPAFYPSLNYADGMALNWFSSPSIMLGVLRYHLWKIPFDGSPWTETDSGMTGEYGVQIAVDPHSPSTVYLAASNGSGVSKSTDGGATWTESLTGCSSIAIAVDPFNSNHVLASVDAGIDPCTVGKYLQVSNDGGVTWSDAPTTHLSSMATSIVFDSKTKGTIYIASGGGGISKSTDGGMTWSAIDNGLSSQASEKVMSLAIDPNNSSTLLAGTLGDGIYKSTDGGSSWYRVNSTQTANYSIAFDPNHAGYVYVAGQTLLRSTDDGDTWTDINPGLNDNAALNVIVDPRVADSIFLIDFNNIVGWSPDAGKTWVWLRNVIPQNYFSAGTYTLPAISTGTPETLYIPSPEVGVVAVHLQH